jgi:hypothetical protein
MEMYKKTNVTMRDLVEFVQKEREQRSKHKKHKQHKKEQHKCVLCNEADQHVLTFGTDVPINAHYACILLAKVAYPHDKFTYDLVMTDHASAV